MTGKKEKSQTFFSALNVLTKLLSRKVTQEEYVEKDSYLDGYLSTLANIFPAKLESALAKDPAANILEIMSVELVKLIEEKDGEDEINAQASRAFLSILLENDQFPVQSQLPVNDIEMLRALLFDYFSERRSISERGMEIMTLIEKKFVRGDFSQARLLLQIFETDEETRLNNERNLFYEEMITRLGDTRTLHEPVQLSKTLQQAAREENPPPELLFEIVRELRTKAGIHLCVFIEDCSQRERWENNLKNLPKAVIDYILFYLPVIRWRLLTPKCTDLLEICRSLLDEQTYRRFIKRHIAMCYFLLLASGNTKHEEYIFIFNEWSQRTFQVDITQVMPLMHRCSVVELMTLAESLELVTERFYAKSLAKFKFDDHAILRALGVLMQKFSTMAFEKVPEGNYSFAGFLLDELLELKWAQHDMSSQLYRLM